MLEVYARTFDGSSIVLTPAVEHIGEPILLNRAGHGLARAPRIAQWRSDFKFLGISLRGKVKPPLGIEASISQRGGVLADAMGHAYVVKACIDGLVDAGVLPDDGPSTVLWTRCWAPTADKAIPKGLIRCRLVLVQAGGGGGGSDLS